MEFKSASIDIEDIDEKDGIVKGYGSFFGNVDSDNDIIIKGAYAKTLSENKARIKYVWQHRIDKPLGTFTELYEDEKGLYFVAKMPPTKLGEDALLLMKNGAISENSVGISVIKSDWRSDGIRVIKEAKLWEISAVTLAANPLAVITDAKGKVDESYVLKRFDTLSRIIKKENVSDELGYAIENEIEKLKHIFKTMFTLPKAEASTEPNEEKKHEASDIYKYLLDTLKA